VEEEEGMRKVFETTNEMNGNRIDGWMDE